MRLQIHHHDLLAVNQSTAGPTGRMDNMYFVLKEISKATFYGKSKGVLRLGSIIIITSPFRIVLPEKWKAMICFFFQGDFHLQEVTI